MAIIKLTPQSLMYQCQKFSGAANELNSINNDISRFVSSLDWEVRGSGNVEGSIVQIAAMGRRLISDTEGLSRYLSTAANLFNEEDTKCGKAIGDMTGLIPINYGGMVGMPIIGGIIGTLITGGKNIIGTRLDWIKSVIGNGNGDTAIVNDARKEEIVTNDSTSVVQAILDLEKRSNTNITNPVPGGVFRGECYQFGRRTESTDLPNGHSGIDINPIDKTIEKNPNVMAAFGGKVSKVGYMPGGYGNYVVVDAIIDGKSCQVFYGHFLDNSIQVKEGDLIDGSTLLAKMGSSGASSGEHLHFEIREYNANTGNYKPVDPIPILNKHNIGF